MAKNTLKRPQARKVENWLLVEKNWQDIEARRLSKEDAASLATTALGFTVTAANLETCVDAIEKKWPASGTKRSKAAYKVIVLKAAIKHLYEAAELPAPTEAIARVLGLPWQKPDKEPGKEPAEEQKPLLLTEAASSTS